MGREVRTNIVVDEDLLDKVMEVYGLKTKRQAVDFALHAVLGDRESAAADPWEGARQLWGLWADRSEEELRGIYGDEFPDRPESMKP